MAAEVVKFPAVAVMAPAVCVIGPVSEISVMLPGTVTAADSVIGPASLSAKLPLAPKAKVGAGNAFACVPKLMLPAEVKVLPVAAVKIPLSVMSPVADVAVSAPPMFDVPKFKTFDRMVAVPVPVVLSETAPVKVFPALPSVMA